MVIFCIKLLKTTIDLESFVTPKNEITDHCKRDLYWEKINGDLAIIYLNPYQGMGLALTCQPDGSQGLSGYKYKWLT